MEAGGRGCRPYQGGRGPRGQGDRPDLRRIHEIGPAPAGEVRRVPGGRRDEEAPDPDRAPGAVAVPPHGRAGRGGGRAGGGTGGADGGGGRRRRGTSRGRGRRSGPTRPGPWSNGRRGEGVGHRAGLDRGTAGRVFVGGGRPSQSREGGRTVGGRGGRRCVAGEGRSLPARGGWSNTRRGRPPAGSRGERDRAGGRPARR